MAPPSSDAPLHCHRHRRTRRRAAPHRVAADNKHLVSSSIHSTCPHHHPHAGSKLRMSTPLSDIDVNPRQPGFKPLKMGSKIPSPPKFQRTGSTDLRSPFSVSTTGSPCYIATPTDTKAVVSPTPTSKLPRKSTPTQGAFSKSYTYGSKHATPRTNLPRSRNWQKPAAIVVPPSSVCLLIEDTMITADLQQGSIRTTPPLSCDKPLPSPPIAQIVNPASPPKAQRTLVDAEAGTPTDEVWPVLKPENVPPLKSPSLSTDGKLPQRSVFETSTLQRNGSSVLESRDITPSVTNRTPSQMSELSTGEEQLSHQRSRHMTEPRIFSPMDPYAKSFHAISTDASVAIDSPLAHKQRSLPAIAIPPRTSSKRSSLLSPDITAGESPTQPSASLRPAQSGYTKWPIFAAADETSKSQVTDRASESDACFTAEPENNESVSFDGANVTRSHYGSIDSVSTWSLAAGSSLDNEAKVNYEGSVRVRRVSSHSSNPESGPTLRISADADAVLLGRDNSIPPVPTLPEHVLQQSFHEHSIGILPGRVTKQILVNKATSAGSRTPSPSLTETETIGSKPVKITPIRSMQPPRKPSSGDLSKRSPSLGTPASTEVPTAKEAPGLFQAQPLGSVESIQEPASFCIEGSSVTSTVGWEMMQSESSTPPVTSGEWSTKGYVGRVKETLYLEANVSYR
jgi:hypothetical protein